MTTYPKNPFILILQEFHILTTSLNNEIEQLIETCNFECAQEKLRNLQVCSQKLGADNLSVATEALLKCLERSDIDRAIFQNFQEKLQETITVVNWMKPPKQD